jgi:hypothetical protein
MGWGKSRRSHLPCQQPQLVCLPYSYLQLSSGVATPIVPNHQRPTSILQRMQVTGAGRIASRPTYEYWLRAAEYCGLTGVSTSKFNTMSKSSMPTSSSGISRPAVENQAHSSTPSMTIRNMSTNPCVPALNLAMPRGYAGRGTCSRTTGWCLSKQWMVLDFLWRQALSRLYAVLCGKGCSFFILLICVVCVSLV